MLANNSFFTPCQFCNNNINMSVQKLATKVFENMELTPTCICIEYIVKLLFHYDTEVKL